jgi:hypothetical protein
VRNKFRFIKQVCNEFRAMNIAGQKYGLGNIAGFKSIWCCLSMIPSYSAKPRSCSNLAASIADTPSCGYYYLFFVDLFFVLFQDRCIR